MDEYSSLCYLDVQKTGSTFVSAFLREHLAEKRIRFAKHGRIRDGYNPQRLYVVTARHPLSQYRSLFRFGVEGQGMLRRALDASGRSRFYEAGEAGFADWLAFMLDPANAEFLREGYAKAPAGLIGFQTFRFLALSFHKPLEVLAPLRSRGDVRAAWEKKRIVRKVLRTETLNADLAALVESDLRRHLRDPEAALAALRAAAPRNATRPSVVAAELPPSLSQRLVEREWFLFDVLGYRLE